MRHNSNCHAVLAIAMLVAGCASQVQLPANVATSNGGDGGSYMERADFSYRADSPPQFSRVKLCIAENLNNDAVTLRDSAGSFVGPATGRYYQPDNRQNIGGGAIFKYSDDAAATLIATGGISANTGLMVRDHIRFDLKASIAGPNVGLVLYNIRRAQENSGILANDGFKPVGVWPGARAPEVYAALEGVAFKVMNCIR